MHDESCGLVHQQKILVLEDQPDGNGFGLQGLLNESCFDPFSTADLIRGSNFCSTNPYEACLDHASSNTTACVEVPGDEPVQALTRLFGGHFEAVVVGGQLSAAVSRYIIEVISFIIKGG